MRKIISVFQRNYDSDRLVRDEVVLGAEWVLSGEGIATRKFDGACSMIQDGSLYKRFDAKHGKKPPYGFIPAQDPDPITGHWPGWIQVENGPEDKWFRLALENTGKMLPNGTYEACGPHFQGNPEGLEKDTLILHGVELLVVPRTFVGIRDWLQKRDIEGIVFHFGGQMAKVKKKDFGLKRKPNGN